MTAYTSVKGNGGAITPNHAGPLVQKIHIDALAEAQDLGLASFGSGDTLTVMNIPAGTFVQMVPINVSKAEGATLTADIGDADDPDGWHDGVNLNAVARSRGVNAFTEGAPNVPTGYTNGKYYAADGVLTILFNNAGVNACKFDLYVHAWPNYS